MRQSLYYFSMPIHRIDREPRLQIPIDALASNRKRSSRFPGSFTQRQRRDRRVLDQNSSLVVAVMATVDAIAGGGGFAEAASAASGGTSGGYYNPGGGGGGGGSIQWNES